MRNPNPLRIIYIHIILSVLVTLIGCDKETDNSSIGSPCSDIDFIEYNGQIYNIVEIGNQCWLKENLNIGTQIQGGDTMKDNNIVEKYCPEDKSINCAVYGGLYQWSELMRYKPDEGAQGICPDGWHIPTESEWEILISFLGGETIAGGMMKENTGNYWQEPNEGATNESGFSALPGGYYAWDFIDFRKDANFWSSSSNSGFASGQILLYNESLTYNSQIPQSHGLSVRCIKNP